MNKIFLALLFLNLQSLAKTEVSTKNIEVIELKSEDEAFKYIGKDKAVAILIYMKGCHYCDLLKPKFDEAAKQDKKHTFIKIEMSKAPSMVKTNNISGFPTTLIFPPHSTAVKEKVVGNNIDGIKKALERYSN